jgi:hypothetical protein
LLPQLAISNDHSKSVYTVFSMAAYLFWDNYCLERVETCHFVSFFFKVLTAYRTSLDRETISSFTDPLLGV